MVRHGWGALGALGATGAGGRGDVNEPLFCKGAALCGSVSCVSADARYLSTVVVKSLESRSVRVASMAVGEAAAVAKTVLSDAPSGAEECARAPLKANVRPFHQPNSQ